jgi:hypothetical protein
MKSQGDRFGDGLKDGFDDWLKDGFDDRLEGGFDDGLENGLDDRLEDRYAVDGSSCFPGRTNTDCAAWGLTKNARRPIKGGISVPAPLRNLCPLISAPT